MQVRRAQSFNAGKETVPCRGQVAADEADLHPRERCLAAFSHLHDWIGVSQTSRTKSVLPKKLLLGIRALEAGVCMHSLTPILRKQIDLTLT